MSESTIDLRVAANLEPFLASMDRFRAAIDEAIPLIVAWGEKAAAAFAKFGDAFYEARPLVLTAEEQARVDFLTTSRLWQGTQAAESERVEIAWSRVNG